MTSVGDLLVETLIPPWLVFKRGGELGLHPSAKNHWHTEGRRQPKGTGMFFASRIRDSFSACLETLTLVGCFGAASGEPFLSLLLVSGGMENSMSICEVPSVLCLVLQENLITLCVGKHETQGPSTKKHFHFTYICNIYASPPTINIFQVTGAL